jgi:hypothetical protein
MPIQAALVRTLAMLTHDLRDAARNLRRNRGFAASAIAILAIGIAASTGYPWLFAHLDDRADIRRADGGRRASPHAESGRGAIPDREPRG